MNRNTADDNFLILAENALEGVLVSQDDKYVFVNHSMATMLGYASPEEILGQPLEFVLHPSVADQIRDRYERRQRGEAVPNKYETLFLKKDGSSIPVEINAAVTTWNGRPAGTKSIRDISSRKAFEEEIEAHKKTLEKLVVRRSTELLETEAKLAHIISSNPNVIYTLKPEDDFPFTYVSENIKDLLGFTVGQCMEPGFWKDHLHPDEAEGVLARLPELTEKGHLSHEYRFRLNDNRYIWLHDELRLLRDANGNPTEVVGSCSDITDRKIAEIKYRSLFELSDDAIITLDMEGFLDCNQATLRMFGCQNKEEFLGKRVWDLSPPLQEDGTDSQVAAERQIDKAYRLGRNQFEWTHRRLNGDDFPAEVLLTPMEISGQRILQAVVRDITDRKQAEIELRESRQSLALALAASHGGFYSLDLVAGRAEWDDRAFEVYGQSRHRFDTSFENIASAIVPEDRDLLERFEKLLEAGKNDWHEIYRVRAENGDIKWIEGFGNIQRAADGTPLRVIGTVVDITQRKEIEEALVESTHQLDLILNSLTDVVWAVSLPDRKPMYCSESFRELFGREVYEWIEDNTIWEEIVHPEDRHIIPRVYAEVRTEGASDLEYRLLRSDGSVVWISSRLKVVPGSGKDPSILLGIVRDISERKRFEESLIRATEAAEEANRAKTEFLSRMSHELRTPMNAILGFGQLLELDADKLTPDQRDSIRHIIEGGEHLLSLINEVLDISRVDAGMMELSVEPVLLEDALQSAITLIGPLANHKGVTIKTEPAHSGCHLLADRQRLIQVLVNLMSNAVKYNNENGEVIISCVTSAANGENGTMRVQVQDTGHGIRQQDFKKIFEPFQRVHVRGAPVEGTGIGLAITRKLVELMDGRIGFESEYGVGTTFWFELPLTAADAAGGDQEMSDREILDLDAEITVLYVEDNAANRKLVSQALGGLSRCNLLSADNAEDGIAIAREKLPDLILMDLGLPGMDGFEALKVLRADNLTSEIPVIAVTAHAMPEFRKKGREAGFDDYLVKPIKINQLFSTFQKHRPT